MHLQLPLNPEYRVGSPQQAVCIGITWKFLFKTQNIDCHGPMSICRPYESESTGMLCSRMYLGNAF